MTDFSADRRALCNPERKKKVAVTQYRVPGCQSCQQLQPVRTLNSILREKPEVWLPCLAHRLNHSNGSKDMSIPTKRLKYVPAHDHGCGEITVSIKQVTQTTVILTLVSAPDHLSQHTLVSAPNHRASHQSAHAGLCLILLCLTSVSTRWFQPQITVHVTPPVCPIQPLSRHATCLYKPAINTSRHPSLELSR